MAQQSLPDIFLSHAVPIRYYFNWIQPIQMAQQSLPDIFLSHADAHLPDTALGRGVCGWQRRACLSPSSLTAFHHYLFLPRGFACPCPPTTAMQARKRRLPRVARRGGRHRPSLGQAQAQLATTKPCHHPQPPACQNQSFLALCCVVRKKGENCILQEYVSSILDVSEVCCKCCISMSQK
jgi:hypothetical protein